ncbi:SDR family oxidoreductase [Rhizobacter sp. OV335]|uniref:SDR family oxidoreductase n=1 Tax=Rhizobacter sp. OV335 TaxID=1500264 RepID=UPI0009194982|nr:SDR family oxidoreductase [Rhizobacter sp. OV335]SHN14714.1 NAD(P)-dependent dehydrogenase, short-chain alcohol dehydrogenase family [Rhizobacter sp. OV335]
MPTKTSRKTAQTSHSDRPHADDGEAVAVKQRRIQSAQDREDAKKPSSGKPADKAPVQAGASRQPVKLPAQHIEKPGLEAELELKPKFLAPYYEGSHKLQDSAALITGGDSGIGRAVAVLFAREGADVAIVYLNEHEDAEETRRCVEAEGGRCVLIPGDVRDPAFCRHAVDQAVKAFGKLDVLVNNAAFQEHAESIEDITDERFDETLRTNVYGYFHMARAALPHMGKGGAIINTGSVTGLEGSAHLLDYSTTKGAIHAFTKSLASNVLQRGIRVNAVAPGPVWTPLNPADSPAEKVAEFGQNTDMRRAAQPEELSPAYVFLASPACSGYITGIVLPVTGSVGAI